MITDYLRWLRLPITKYYSVEPVEPIPKEFPLEKHEDPEPKKEPPEEPSEDQPEKKRKRLSIWV